MCLAAWLHSDDTCISSEKMNWCLQLVSDTLNIIFENLYNFSDTFVTTTDSTWLRINKTPIVFTFWATVYTRLCRLNWL